MTVPPELLAAARRLGPRPWSTLGPAAPGPGTAGGAEAAGWVAEAVVSCWRRLGRPDPFTVVEIGAGDGSRAAAVLRHLEGAAVRPSLRYVLVEPDGDERERHRGRLALEQPELLLGPMRPLTGGDEEVEVDPRSGPLVTSLPDLPSVPGPQLLVAVGWLSRLPADRYRWERGRWWEQRLVAAGDGLRPTSVPAAPVVASALARLAPNPAEGGVVAWQQEAADTVAAIRRRSGPGALVAVEEGTTTTAMASVAGAEPRGLALDQMPSGRSAPVVAADRRLSPRRSYTWRLA
ncbi:MAG TPA: SAM-dependent methyltransferase [Acidimicrobiales bacterium]|nr:SAM-dependent methyltransferase [Acidimicrobiales bacterium]